MNDLQLLVAHGPAAVPLHDDVLDRARTALLAEVDGETRPRTPQVPRVVPPGPRSSTRRRFSLGLVAASAAGALLAPSLLGLDSSGAIALAPHDPLWFPLTPTTVPAGLDEPIFEMDSGFMAARYGAGAVDGFTVTTKVDSVDFWSIPENTRDVDVSGHQAKLYSGVTFDGTTTSAPTMSLVWKDDNGEWTRVTGRGTYADAGRVESFAESLTKRPQPVNLSLDVAPEGWSIDAYKEDRILTLAPDDGRADMDVTVSLVDNPPEDFASAYSVGEITNPRIHNGEAQVGRHAEGWMVLADTSDGQAFTVSAPEVFTRDQVIALAEGVTATG